MAGDSKPPVDLLGDPWSPPRDPRGRKSHRVTPQGREIVAQLVAAGSDEEDIARTMGLCTKTLRKYYFRELDHGVALARNEVIRKLYKMGMAGNVAAMKAYLAETAKGETRLANSVPRPVAEKPLGKKAQREADAHGVAGLYAPGAPPARQMSH